MRRAGGICSFLTIDQYLVTASPRKDEFVNMWPPVIRVCLHLMICQYVASCHQSMPSPNDDIMHIFFIRMANLLAQSTGEHHWLPVACYVCMSNAWWVDQ